MNKERIERALRGSLRLNGADPDAIEDAITDFWKCYDGLYDEYR